MHIYKFWKDFNVPYYAAHDVRPTNCRIVILYRWTKDIDQFALHGAIMYPILNTDL